MSKERAWLLISKVLPEEWTNADAKQLRDLLANPILLKAFQHAYLCEEDLKVQLATNVDFVDARSLAQANILKGQLKGVTLLMDRFLDLSEAIQETSDDRTDPDDISTDAESGDFVSAHAEPEPSSSQR